MPAKKGQVPWNKGRKRPKPSIEEKRKVTAEMRKRARLVQADNDKTKVVPAARPEIVDYPSVGKDVDKYGPRNLEFEQKLGVPPPEPAAKEGPSAETRARFAEAVQDSLDRKIVADCLKLPFAFWASRAGLPALRLTDQEAKEWAEPTKALLDHYMPKIPGIVYAWVGWSVCTCSIMDKRFVLITAEREKRSAQRLSEIKGAPLGSQSREASASPSAGPIAQGAPKYEPKRV